MDQPERFGTLCSGLAVVLILAIAVVSHFVVRVIVSKNMKSK